MLLLALVRHNQKKNRDAIEQFEQNFENLKTLKKNVKDEERLDAEQKIKLEEEAEEQMMQSQ